MSFYLVLFEYRKDESDLKLNYWLDSVVKRIKNPKIILICTHGNEVNKDLANEKMESIKNNYSNFILFHISITCLTYKNVG